MHNRMHTHTLGPHTPSSKFIFIVVHLLCGCVEFREFFISREVAKNDKRSITSEERKNCRKIGNPKRKRILCTALSALLFIVLVKLILGFFSLEIECFVFIAGRMCECVRVNARVCDVWRLIRKTITPIGCGQRGYRFE